MTDEAVILPDRWYDADEAAALLKLRATIRPARALARLGIPFAKGGRARIYKGADLLAWLERTRKQTVQRIA